MCTAVEVLANWSTKIAWKQAENYKKLQNTKTKKKRKNSKQ